MRAALLSGPYDLRISEVNTPVIREDEILVKVMACGICGTDIHTYRTGSDTSSGPIIPGHEFSGEIVALGSAVQGLEIGNRVVGTGIRPCGECARCKAGQPSRCPNPKVPGEGLDGAMADYVVIPNPLPGILFLQIPDTMDWEEAATIEPLSVSCYAVSRARLKEGAIVAVIGAGMIGQGIVQVSRALGADRVIVSEPSEVRRNVARMSGADITVNPMEADPVEAIAEVTGGDMVDILFECSGSPGAFRQAAHMIKPFGQIIQVGMFEEPLMLDPETAKLMFQFRNVTLRGSGGQRWDMALELLVNGKVRTMDLITHRFPLERAKEAFETQLNANEAIKVLVTMS